MTRPQDNLSLVLHRGGLHQSKACFMCVIVQRRTACPCLSREDGGVSPVYKLRVLSAGPRRSKTDGCHARFMYKASAGPLSGVHLSLAAHSNDEDGRWRKSCNSFSDCAASRTVGHPHLGACFGQCTGLPSSRAGCTESLATAGSHHKNTPCSNSETKCHVASQPKIKDSMTVLMGCMLQLMLKGARAAGAP